MKLTTPYPGLRPFEEHDQMLFFGREAQISGVLRQLEDHAFVAVLGSSGSGKSSLVRAGLLPAVRQGFLLGTESWLVIVLKPGHQPYNHLAQAICAAINRERGGREPGSDLTPSEESQILETLLGSDRGLLTAFERFGAPIREKVLLVVDQFEELFAFRRTTARSENVASRDEAAAFVNTLLSASADPEATVRVVLTMRSDFVGDCEAFLGLPEAVSRSQFLVPRLDRGQMDEAIRRPGETEDAGFQRFSFEDGLVNRIINDAGDRPDQLPLMQHALMRTWKLAGVRAGVTSKIDLTHDDYNAAGGITEALSRHAEHAWKQIEGIPAKEELARRLFLLLCDISPDGQITRRRPRVDDVRLATGASIEDIEVIVRLFQDDDRSFLLPATKPLKGTDLLDISHEALLRQWPRFSRWQTQERQDSSELARLAEMADLNAREKGGVLSAQDLARVADWRQRVSLEWARRYVSEKTWVQVVDYVQKSKKEAKKQDQKKQALYALLVLFLLLGAGASFLLMLRAEREKTSAQMYLRKGLTRTIGVSANRDPSPDEQVALWELAELNEDNAQVREKIIDEWLGSETAISRALNNNGRGLRAAAGISGPVVEYVVSRSKESAEALTAELENPQTAETRLDKVAASIGNLKTILTPADAAAIVQRLSVTLKNPQVEENHALKMIAVLSALAGRIDRDHAGPASLAVGEAFGAISESATRWDKQSGIATVIGNLAPVMDATAVDQTTNRVLQAFNKLATNSSKLADLIAKLAPRLEVNATAKLAESLVALLLEPQRLHDETFVSAAKSVEALAVRIDSKNAAVLAESIGNALRDSREIGRNRKARLAITRASLLSRTDFPAGAFTKEWDSLMTTFVATRDESITAEEIGTLTRLLAKIAPELENKEIGRAAESVALAFETPDETAPARLEGLRQIMAALSSRLGGGTAAALAGRFVNAIQETDDTDRMENLAGSLADLSPKIYIGDAARLAKKIVLLVDPKSDEFFPERSPVVVKMLVALAPKLSSVDAVNIAEQISGFEKDVDFSEDASQFSGFIEVLAALAPNLGSDTAIIRHADQVIRLVESDFKSEGVELEGFFTSFSALALRIPAAEASRLVGRYAKWIEDPKEKDRFNLEEASRMIAALAPQVRGSGTSSAGEFFTQAMEKRHETDPGRLVSLSSGIPALAPHLQPSEATTLAEHFVKAQEDLKEKDIDILIELSGSVTALLPSIAPPNASSLAIRNAKALLRNLEDSDANSADVRATLGLRLAGLSAHVPAARTGVGLFALSNILLRSLLTDQSTRAAMLTGRQTSSVESRKLAAIRLLALLSPQDLAGVLKWPFCVGEAEKVVLAELERKTRQTFDGNLRTFIERAPSLDIRNLDTPAKRPRIEDAQKELH